MMTGAKAIVVACLFAMFTVHFIDNAVAQDGPAVPIGANAGLSDEHANIWATRSDRLERPRSHEKGSTTRTLTSYRPVCAYQKQLIGHSISAAGVGVCRTSTAFCSGQEPRAVAMWVMRARSSPQPGPDDWMNTGAMACVGGAKVLPRVAVSQADFRRLPIPAPRILTQPPDRVTLINIGTNFLTVKEPVVLPTVVLGQRVRVRATPARYAWAYGDGHTLVTADPGHRYPHMPTAHTYTQPGTFTISLATTFTGEFSVAGGPWQPIQGTATARSVTVQVTAEERRAVLIS